MSVWTRLSSPGARLAVVALALLAASVPAAAQTVPPLPDTPTSPRAPSTTTWDGPLAGLLPAFFGDMAIVAPGDAAHTQHFLRGLQTTVGGLELGQALAGQVSSFPVVTPAGSFVFGGNGSTGEMTLTTRAPIVGDRGTTLGQGNFAFGLSFQRAKADAISDLDLDSGEIMLYAPHNNCCGPSANPAAAGDGNPASERDVLQQSVGIELRQSVTTLSASYGITSRLDVAVVLPLVKVDLDARVTSRIRRLGTAATPAMHSFDGIDLANRTISRSGSATGLGDVRLRARLNVRRSAGSAMALAVDASMPTGDADNFLGSGGTRLRGGFAASVDRGRLSPYLNGGYTYVSGSTSELASTWAGALDPAISSQVDRTLPHEIDYAGGLTFASAPWMTFEASVTGRTLLDAPRFAIGGAFGDELLADARGTVHRVVGVTGVRLRAGARMLFTAGVVLPIADNGLRAKARPVVSLDYVF